MNLEPTHLPEGVAAAALPGAPNEILSMSPDQAWTLLVKGFDPMEHKLLNGVVMLSRRRLPRLDLLDEADGEGADVVMIDARDPLAMKWAASQPWLKHKTVIWVDAPTASPGHLLVRRPVQWTSIPLLLARALEQGPRKAIKAQRPASARRSVLVVDDSLAVRAYLRSLLEPRGYAVTDVASAEAGVEAAAAAPYACVLMDVLLPGIDGYEACRRIKAGARAGAGAPAIVMLTSKSSPFDRLRGMMAGCDAYLSKPVSANELHETLSRYVGGPALTGAAMLQLAQAA